MNHAPGRCVNVLVVDDSAFTRRAIVRMLGSDPLFKVVGQAADGREALRLLKELPVDVVTLDIEMPGLDGLKTLEILRSEHDVPVVVLSGRTGAGATTTLTALDLGAFDVVPKPDGGPLAIHDITHELTTKIRAAVGYAKRTGKTGPLGPLPLPSPAAASRVSPAPPARRASVAGVELVLIGISTGGPPALQKLIPALPADLRAPIVVLQHMPPGYTKALADRLDKSSALRVREAEENDPLLPGTVLVAPAGRQLIFRRTPQGLRVHLTDECPYPSFYRPCIDFTFQEAARMLPGKVLGVIMTGMGNDGSAGLKAIKEAGGVVWAQDEASSAIYGMPRAAYETGRVDEVVSLERLPQRLIEGFKTP